MDIFQFWKLLDNLRQSLMEIGLRKPNFTHVKLSDPGDLVVFMDDSWRFPLSL